MGENQVMGHGVREFSAQREIEGYSQANCKKTHAPHCSAQPFFPSRNNPR